jgi:hypothetical protein
MKKHQFIISLLICFGLACFLSSCDSDREDRITDLGSGDVLIVSASVFENTPSTSFTLRNVEISGDILTVTISASGCDGSSWRVNLITTGAVGLSEPPYRGVKLCFENGELCDAIITKDFSFNISNLRVAGSNRVRLNISGREVLYVY